MGGACTRPFYYTKEKGLIFIAVPVHERSESKISFLDNAEKLQQLTNDIVMNDKYVPKKYRYTWTQEVFLLSMHVFENVRRANIIYPKNKEELRLRMKHFINAEHDAEAILSQTAFARKNFSIPNGLQQDWEKLCVNTKNSIRRRRKDDYERFSQLITTNKT